LPRRRRPQPPRLQGVHPGSSPSATDRVFSPADASIPS
jgi:hypothetical protein